MKELRIRVTKEAYTVKDVIEKLESKGIWCGGKFDWEEHEWLIEINVTNGYSCESIEKAVKRMTGLGVVYNFFPAPVM